VLCFDWRRWSIFIHATFTNAIICPAEVRELPPKEAEFIPFDDKYVDLVRPRSVTFNRQSIEFHALTAVDPATGLAKPIHIHKKVSAHVSMKFENKWLTYYSYPPCCIHDNKTEFTGSKFQPILQVPGISDVPMMVKKSLGKCHLWALISTWCKQSSHHVECESSQQSLWDWRDLRYMFGFSLIGNLSIISSHL